MVSAAYVRVTAILQEKSEQLELLAQHLIKHEVLNHRDMVRLLGPRPFAMDKRQEDVLALAYADSPALPSIPPVTQNPDSNGPQQPQPAAATATSA
jgi:hypothetical protein